MSRFSAVASAVALALMAVSPAAAATYVVKGVVSISDLTGVIGSAGEQFTRDFTLTFRRNDALGDFQNDGKYSLLGGYGANNPVTSTLEIGTFTYDFGSGYGEQYQTKVNAGGEGFEFYSSNDTACAAPNCVVDQSYAYINVVLGPGSYLPDHLIYSLPSLTKAETPAFLWLGGFSISRMVFENGSPADFQYVSGQFDIASITVAAPTQGVPEPATWTVMIVGLAGVGHVLRRRRTLTDPTTS